MATTHNPIKLKVDKESFDQYWVVCDGCSARWAGPYISEARAREIAEGMNGNPRYQVHGLLRSGICCELIPYGVDREDSYRIAQRVLWGFTKTDYKVLAHLAAIALGVVAVIFCLLGFMFGGGWLTVGSTLLSMALILGMVCVLIGDGSEDGELTSDVYTRHRMD